VNDILVDSVQQLNQPVELLQKPFGQDESVDTIEDKEIYSELQKLNVNIDDIKAANLRHEQLIGVLEVLRNNSSCILQETQSNIQIWRQRLETPDWCKSLYAITLTLCTYQTDPHLCNSSTAVTVTYGGRARSCFYIGRYR
jgi:hypothetical protein